MEHFLKVSVVQNNLKGLINKPGFLVFIVLLWGVLYLPPVLAKDKPQLMLLKTYQPGLDVSGWVMSEKLDGVRAYWDGKRLISRQGNVFNPPVWFVENFPSFELDGELWLGRERFSETISIVNTSIPDERWKEITYNIFEVPNLKGGLMKRLAVLQEYLGEYPNKFIRVIPQNKILSNEQMDFELQRIIGAGGEGLVVRNPKELYQTGRLESSLKVKQKQDAECIVKGYTDGKGKYHGKVGALICELIDSQVERLFPELLAQHKPNIKIGSGLSDELRVNPPKIGVTITFQYMGLTKTGLPRFPVFLRERKDDIR
jgi:DNA ligase-1